MIKQIMPRCVALFLLLIGCGDIVLAQSPEKTVTDKPKQLFLLIGQSNMAGRGPLDAISKQITPHVYKFNRAQQWEPATDPLHFDKPGAGVGPGLAFGQEMARAYPTAEIGLIPCAVGGTAISKWQKGAYDPVTKTHPYDDAIVRAKAALRSGTLKGILWHQGEGDRGNDLYTQYESRFDILYANLERDLGINLDTIPVLLGELGPFNKTPAAEVKTLRIDSVLHSIAAKRPNMACISAAGLHHRGDTLHFDTPSARKLGRRYAVAYLQLRQKMRVPDSMLTAMNRVEMPAFTDILPGAKTGTAYRVLVIGNSLTLHGTAKAIGWNHTSGMAATSPEHDYVHLLKTKIENKLPGKRVCMRLSNFAAFERSFNQFDWRQLDSLRSYKPQLVIFQLGENVKWASATDSIHFEQQYTSLIQHFQKAGHPVICATLPFFYSAGKNEVISRVAKKTDILLADLSKLAVGDKQNLSKYETNYPGDRSVWKNEGIGVHPGNFGMTNIANELFDTIVARL